MGQACPKPVLQNVVGAALLLTLCGCLGPRLGTQLHELLERADTQGALRLLESHPGVANADVEGSSVLAWAIEARQQAVALALIERGADVKLADAEGYTPLHAAAMRGAPAVAERLLAAGASPAAATRKGFTPLHCAATTDDEPTARALLATGGASPGAQTGSGETALHIAARRGSARLCEVLIEGGAPVNARDSCGCTPLHWAAKEGHTDAARVLLSRGADPNAQESELGVAPLHAAAVAGRREVALALIERGADVSLRASDGKTPLDAALCFKQWDLYDLLFRAGGEPPPPLPAADAVPEDLVEWYLRAMAARDVSAVAARTHRGEIAKLKGMVLPGLRAEAESGEGSAALRAFLQGDPITAVDAFPPETFYARFLQCLATANPDLTRVMRDGTVTPLGRVSETTPDGDVAHVLYRLVLHTDEVTITKLSVMSFAREDGMWKAMLSGEIQGLADAIGGRRRSGSQQGTGSPSD